MFPQALAVKRTNISTILTVDERMRVDAAGGGSYRAYHRTEAAEILRDVRSQRTSAILVSVRYYETKGWDEVSRMIREIPRVPTVAILTEQTEQTPEALLRLGRDGVRHVVDVRLPDGWNELRDLLSEECGDAVEDAVVKRLRKQSREMNDECWVFFQTLFRTSRYVASIRELAEHLEILPSTLMSRFYRVGLPTPKRYLATMRLVRAAYLFENAGFSIANVANHLDYSSPQSFGRHIRKTMRMTALEFRHQYDGTQMLDLFEQKLISPYNGIFEQFRPLSAGCYWKEKTTRPRLG